MAKRADVMITSTLSMSLFPKDRRQVAVRDRISMDQEAVDEYVDEKSAFKSLVK